ncbi:hypothetical protein Tco_0652265 [Tanacetum coccineum]|uniref:Uncharacterized protein n=1 Tax=Tanacetum coccineum TaxID=301880 RepID=A0ABQ4WXT0_9ASTR
MLRRSTKTPVCLYSTPVFAELHKEALQATSGLTSLGVNGHDASTTFTAKDDLDKSDPKDSLPPKQGTDEGTINYSFDHVIEGTYLSVLVDKTQSARDGLETIQTKTRTKKEPTTKHLFETDTKDISGDDEDDIQVEVQTKTKDTFVPHPSQSRKSIKIQDLLNQDLLLQSYNYKLEKEKATTKDEATFLKAQPSFLNVQHLIELLVNSLKPELDKMLKDHDFSASLPSEQKGLPTKFDEINGSLGQLKRYAETLEIEVPRDLKELLAKLYPTKTTPHNEGQQIKDKWKKVMSHEEEAEEESDSDSDAETRPSGTLEEYSKSKPLTKFTHITEKGERYQMTEEEINNQKGIKQVVNADAVIFEIKKGKKYLIKTVGQDVVEKVMDACPKRTGAGWNTIYTHMRQKLDAIYKTKQELELDLSRPLEEQNPIIKLNLFSKKERKNVVDLHDYFKSTKSIEDFEELNNDMLYHVQEIFFRLHRGPRMDYLARTFSSFLIVGVDKRNLNPLKKMRLIEQQRQ